ncbi:MAG: hypothetical protein AB7O88_08450 [Reyranellaceae bacterium]
MSIIARGLMLAALAVVSPARAADPPRSLLDLPVAGSKLIAPAGYDEAARLAAKGGTPVDIALAIAGRFEGRAQYIVQINEGAESPRAAKLTIIRDGLLDDSMKSARWDVSLRRSSGANWGIVEARLSWRC